MNEGPNTKTVSTSKLVEALLRAKVYQFARATVDAEKVGMYEEEYAARWPREVRVPTGYPLPLLRDDTLSLKVLCECSGATLFMPPDRSRVRSGVPEFLVGLDGQRLARAVTFWTHEERGSGDIPLICPEGFGVIIQYGDVLCEFAISLLGSEFGSLGIPYVGRFRDAKPSFSAIRSGEKGCHPGFRCQELIPVL